MPMSTSLTGETRSCPGCRNFTICQRTRVIARQVFVLTGETTAGQQHLTFSPSCRETITCLSFCSCSSAMHSVPSSEHTPEHRAPRSTNDRRELHAKSLLRYVLRTSAAFSWKTSVTVCDSCRRRRKHSGCQKLTQQTQKHQKRCRTHVGSVIL